MSWNKYIAMSVVAALSSSKFFFSPLSGRSETALCIRLHIGHLYDDAPSMSSSHRPVWCHACFSRHAVQKPWPQLVNVHRRGSEFRSCTPSKQIGQTTSSSSSWSPVASLSTLPEACAFRVEEEGHAIPEKPGVADADRGQNNDAHKPMIRRKVEGIIRVWFLSLFFGNIYAFATRAL